jgi:hypothetical protein
VATKKKETAKRNTVAFDAAGLEDIVLVRSALRASSDSEAIRYCVRKLSWLIRQQANGASVLLVKGAEKMHLDIPVLSKGGKGDGKTATRVRAQKGSRKRHRS